MFILHKSIFLHFVRYGTKCYDKHIKYDDRKKYIDDDESNNFPKKRVRNIYNTKYLATYSNQNYVLDRDYIKDTRIRRVYSGRKRNPTGLCIFKVNRIVILKDHQISDHVFMMQ